MSILVIAPPSDRPEDGVRLNHVLTHALADIPCEICTDMTALPSLSGRKILFAIPLGAYGICHAYITLLARLRADATLLHSCVGGMIVDGLSPLYTKSTASELAFTANQAGCFLLGRPLVEGVAELDNFRIQAKNLGCDKETAYLSATQELAQRLLDHSPIHQPRPNILALHASSYHVSNTLALWNDVKANLAPSCDITELCLRNGTLYDCSGCPYTTCLHFGEQGGCFYGGIMTDEVYPAVRQADAIVMICPNYNDALSANLTAFINRLTALFRQTRFYDKALFAIVVSGYSGGDIVARQLISSLNMNKSFYLPPNFAMIETANHPNEALSLPEIQARITEFSAQILDICAR